MSAVALRRLPVMNEPPQPRLFAIQGGGQSAPTLDALLTGAWSTLTRGTAVTCPICSETMAPRWSAGAGAVGGRCDGCGSTLD